MTCVLCTTPVYGGYQKCWSCSQQGSLSQSADIVVPLTYAVARTQSGTMMRHYKDDDSPEVRRRHTQVIRRLLYLGIVQHERCVEAIVGHRIDRRIAIPSNNGRIGIHPFIAMAQGLKAVSESPQLVPGTESVGEREISTSRFGVQPSAARFDGEHVLILDDTWTTGSRTQSAAVLLRQLGATHVSVMVVARWIEPGWSDNGTFIKRRLVADFDPGRCPATGADCPG